MAFKSVLNPKFKYRNASSTDVGKTFKRIRREQRRRQRLVTEAEASRAERPPPGEAIKLRKTR